MFEDLLTFLLVLGGAYLAYKNKDKISKSFAEKVNAALQGAKKFVTFVFIVLGIAFILGELYAAMIYGYFPHDELFWLPFYILFLLLLYYVVG